MTIYLHKFETQADCDAYTGSENYVEPFTAIIAENSGKVVYNVSSGSPVPPTPIYSAMPFTIEVLSGSGSISLYPIGDSEDYLYYSVNGGEWYNAANFASVPISAGDVIQFKGLNQVTSSSDSEASGPIYINNSSGLSYVFYGNIMSLVRDSNFENMVTFPDNDMTFYQYFGSDWGSKCLGLISAEHLILPATALTDYCYNSMFNRCTSLTTAPELPATTLTNYCYSNMFGGCTSLNYIKCLATDISASNCTSSWMYNTSSSGTFVKNPNMSNWTTGDDGIPSNWTVEDAS